MDHGDKVKCTNCKCWRIPDEYIGARGGIVKCCKKCRDKDILQKNKPEQILIRNKRQCEKQYYKAYREKKREENEEEYLKHNAEIQKNWRNNNKEQVAKWKTNNINFRLCSIKQQARKKGYEWSDTMTKEVCTDLMSDYCVYCNFKSTETVNGIDRVDNSIGYTISNCVSCCSTCNYMKCALNVNTFIKICSHVSGIHYNEGQINYDILQNTKRSNYSAYKTRAIKKNLEFEFSKEEFDTICKMICYYCHKQNNIDHTNGIDRVDNSIGYIQSNCVSCCSTCNYMKGSLEVNTFIKQCNTIYNTTKDFMF